MFTKYVRIGALVLLPWFGVQQSYAQTPAAASGMRQTFSETFDAPLSWCSDVCNGERWRTKYSHSGSAPLSRDLGINGTDDIMMDPSYLGLGVNPFHINNRTLSISIEPASPRVKTTVQAAWPWWWGGPHPAPKFTAGMLTTEKSFNQRYGYFEARIKVSDVRGTWPAFWLLGPPGNSDIDEIDIMEMLGGRPTQQHMSHKWGGPETGKKNQGFTLDTIDLSRDFHTYGLLWTAETIAYYLDDVQVAKFSNPGLHYPMYMIISSGMDGSWNEQEHFMAAHDAHSAMQVKWVKAYQ